MKKTKTLIHDYLMYFVAIVYDKRMRKNKFVIIYLIIIFSQFRELILIIQKNIVLKEVK